MESISSSRPGRAKFVKIFVLLKTIYRFNSMPIKMPVACFNRNSK